MPSGHSLEIGQAEVKAQVFERRAAAWIYESVRSRALDPSVAFMQAPGKLRIHVFPLAAGETRRCWFEFIHPDGITPTFYLEGKQVKAQTLPPATKAERDEAEFVVENSGSLKNKQVKREPYALFLIDATAASSEKLPKELAPFLKGVSERLGLKKCQVMAAALDCVKTTGVIDVADLGKEPLKIAPKNSGLLLDNALKAIVKESDKDKASFPVIVFLSGNPDLKLERYELSFLPRLLPETGGILAVSPEGVIKGVGELRSEQNGASGPYPLRFQPTAWLEGYGHLRLWRPLPRLKDPAKEPKGLYAQGIKLEELWQRKAFESEPAKSKELFKETVALSKSSGLLSPCVSYIVVENDSQWKDLAKAEKEALSGNRDFTRALNADEPGLWGYLLAAALFLLGLFGFRKLRRKGKLG
jgi:hypothetical protein